MGGPSGTIAQSSPDVTNIRQSRIPLIQKLLKRDNFPTWTGTGQFCGVSGGVWIPLHGKSADLASKSETH